MSAFSRSLSLVCRMIKIEHSVFALPFAYTGLLLASKGKPPLVPFLALTVGMVAVRSFAMTFNRLADLSIDRQNPRTRTRPLVTGELGLPFTWTFLAATAGVFVAACWALNPLCLALAVPALVWSAFYSLTKRFTWMCHFALGSVLGLAPLAGWLAVDPRFGVNALPALLLFCGVTCWVAGFDILYACQDEDFDRGQGLWSIPARFGTVAAMGAILWYEHRIISPDDLTRVNTAFFTLNGVVAVGMFLGAALDLWFT
jgi:4-hydroxybenzoate polyprenyltransferase